ncbi:unnamed protein product [Malus baccata var. baccata]
MATSKAFLFFFLLSTSQVFFVSGTKFEVGGKSGWEVPKSKNSQQMYNEWASKNRFKVDDALCKSLFTYSLSLVAHNKMDKQVNLTFCYAFFMDLAFNYTKDSVMVVTKDEYEKCHSAHPIFYSNNGATTFTLDRPGLFYFISGVAGHCERGQKMIIKVLEPARPPQSADQNATDPSQPKHGSAATAAISSAATLVFCMVSFVVFHA